MKINAMILALTTISCLALAQDVNPVKPAPVAPAPEAGLFDNLYLDAGVGGEQQKGEAGTPFAQAGANWAIPLTPPEGPAFALQAANGLKLRNNDPEWNTTLGGFTRNLPTGGNQQGALALLFDYQHTALHNDLWAMRPVAGATISDRDALGIEGVVGLNQDRNQEPISRLTSFWTRGWSEEWGTEFGVGYEFNPVDKPVFRARAAVGLTPSMDFWFGGDFNSVGNFAMGLGISYHFGATGRHASLDNIGGSGTTLFTPFPSRDYPALFRRTR